MIVTSILELTDIPCQRLNALSENKIVIKLLMVKLVFFAVSHYYQKTEHMWYAIATRWCEFMCDHCQVSVYLDNRIIWLI